MARIFLCHASEDKAPVRDVYRRLAAIQGFEPWLDEEDLLPGQIWEVEIPRALKASEFILVFFSRNSVAKRGYVQREMKLALDVWAEMPSTMTHTIPVRLDECELPEPFGRYHRADLFDARGFDRLVRGLYFGLEQRGNPILTPLKPPPVASEQTSIAEDLPPAIQSQPVAPATDPEDTPAAAESITALPSFFINSVGMEFVLIPEGNFIMGSPDSNAEASDWEKPAHRITISQPFYLGKYPITQAQWEAVMGDNPSYFKGNPNHPVEDVSWHDVQAFMHKLNEREGSGDYRLPSEVQWEYACRAGVESSRYHHDVGAIAWYKVNSQGQTHPVGEKWPNAWDLYDMLGNVWEWCHDGLREYTADAAVDAIGPTEADTPRVLRGGSWGQAAQIVRGAYRGYDAAGNRYTDLGFRCSRSGPSK